MERHPTRPIKRLLVANRGEIAVRIINAARELDMEVYAVYTDGDATHTRGAAKAIKLRDASSYMDINELIDIARQHGIDAVHPGYGFLSESAEFARRMWAELSCVVVGPGAAVLERTGDKLMAKRLAQECDVPTLQALDCPTDSLERLRGFANAVGYPIMVKAVDGGGGRGIRLIASEDQLSTARRAIEESPSKQVFAEKAAITGYRHIEVQIIGDSHGTISDLWERECSIQRRYQKIVEQAPSSLLDRGLVQQVIDAATRMAKRISYSSLGTFEFLVNPETGEFYFLEVNPRLQVEHTVSESVASLDLVSIQLQLAQGAALADVKPTPYALLRDKGAPPPQMHSIQLRVTAENLHSGWSLSMGKISSFQLPAGPGIRVDTHLFNGHSVVVGPNFDSLIAKIIITSSAWEAAARKAARALEDIRVDGVKTNVDVLRAIVAHPDFLAGRCDTSWLEANQARLLQAGEVLAQSVPATITSTSTGLPASAGILAASSSVFQKGDAWSITLAPQGTARPDPNTPKAYLAVTKVLRNEFPNSLAAEIQYTAATAASSTPKSQAYTLHLQSTSASAGAVTSTFRRGQVGNPQHVVIPFSGKLIEYLVEEGDIIRKGDVVCVVQQMKMELEVRASKSGKVTWTMEADEGDEVGEGTLAAEIEVIEDAQLPAKL